MTIPNREVSSVTEMRLQFESTVHRRSMSPDTGRLAVCIHPLRSGYDHIHTAPMISRANPSSSFNSEQSNRFRLTITSSSCPLRRNAETHCLCNQCSRIPPIVLSAPDSAQAKWVCTKTSSLCFRVICPAGLRKHLDCSPSRCMGRKKPPCAAFRSASFGCSR